MGTPEEGRDQREAQKSGARFACVRLGGAFEASSGEVRGTDEWVVKDSSSARRA